MKGPAKILVVDDDPAHARVCGRILDRLGYGWDSETSSPKALDRLQREAFDLVLTDLVMPELTGIQLVEALRKRQDSTPVVVMTGYATVKTAVEAMRLGAQNYITKPIDRLELAQAIEPVLKVAALEAQVKQLQTQLEDVERIPGLIASAPAMEEVRDLVRAASRSRAPTLIHGPSGAGKEVIARAIHSLSRRREGPFVPVNCGALPEGLAESELFGHAKGAFTGAEKPKPGLFRAAAGGTIFLDEIGEMPLEAQVKLLRVLQEGAFRPVGELEEVPVDVRVLSATNRDPREAISSGRLRQDLYFRLAVLEVQLPSLAERPEDLPELASTFLEDLAQEFEGQIPRLSPEALEILQAYSWPGNLRELRNVLYRVLALGKAKEEILPKHLPKVLRRTGRGAPVAGGEADLDSEPPGEVPEAPFLAAPKTLKEGEAVLIQKALERCRGNKSKAARELGISRPLLYKRIKEFGLE